MYVFALVTTEESGNMPSKKELLNAFTREQLRSIATQYEIPFEQTWRKEEFIKAIGGSRKLDAEAIANLSSKVADKTDIQEAINTTRQDYFGQTAGAVFKQIDLIVELLSEALAVNEMVEPGHLSQLVSQANSVRKGKINESRNVPPAVWSQFTAKQRGAFGTARSMSYQLPKFIESAVNLAQTSETLSTYAGWKTRNLPSRVEYYVLQGYRAYYARCYDACIVMLARAIEYLLKGLLNAKSIKYSESATLGALVTLYKTKIADDKVLEKVMEVANMDRIISAHDVPPYEKQMQIEDANHAKTALEIVLRELLK